eukprot:8459222-Heterocapsa_arctica.AAC.1
MSAAPFTQAPAACCRPLRSHCGAACAPRGTGSATMEELGPPTEEETAPTPYEDEEMIGPSAEMGIQPAEYHCGDLKSCIVDASSKHAVLADLCVANDS